MPFIARMVESSAKEVDEGVIEAAKAMGAGNFTIITRVLLVEARTSLITGATIAIGTILGYSAMAGTVGGGGLGDIAIRYGYYRYQSEIMIVTVVLLVILGSDFPVGGNESLHLYWIKENRKQTKTKGKRRENMKKVTAIILTGILTLGVLTGCQSNSKAEEKGSSEDAKTIKVAASATPHAEILEQAKSILKKEGYQLEVTVFDDYVQPNEVVESGEFDANYFQHVPYLESFNEEKGTHLVDAGDIHYEPFGIYPGTKKSLDEISEGDKIASAK